MGSSNFSSINLNTALVSNLQSLGYTKMTPIQEKSLPFIVAGKDVIAQAKTGSGKTAAFALGLLQNLQVKKFRVQALVLCPTRELADQVAKEIRRLARAIHNIKVLTLCGGVPMGPQIGSLEHGAHIIVGTPGRIEDHLNKGRLNLEEVDTLVLDEADRMLEMGFQETLDLIFSECPSKRQNLLFSATFPEQIKPIAKRIMKNPVTIEVTATHNSNIIKQHFYEVENNNKRLLAVRLLLQQHKPESAVIFCNTKVETQQVSQQLNSYGFSTIAIHGDLEQRERDQALILFSNKSVSVLVATDVAARGLDIESLGAVINYQLSRDPEVHVHRIGRTGRAGSHGVACSIITEKERYQMLKIETYLNQSLEIEALPSEQVLDNHIVKPRMTTLQIDAGKKHKLRAGDILGALTSKENKSHNYDITGKNVGKIQIFDIRSFVAVELSIAKDALTKLNQGKMKGRSFKARIIPFKS